MMMEITAIAWNDGNDNTYPAGGAADSRGNLGIEEG
jgi:hypothetical protein